MDLPRLENTPKIPAKRQKILVNYLVKFHSSYSNNKITVTVAMMHFSAKKTPLSEIALFIIKMWPCHEAFYAKGGSNQSKIPMGLFLHTPWAAGGLKNTGKNA